MNITGFDKIAPYLTHPLVLRSCFGLLFLGVLLKYGERKGRLPHLVFFLILLLMGAVIFIGKEDKAIWIPAAIAMLGIAAPVALTWKSSAAGANTVVPFDADMMAKQLYAQLDRKDEQLTAKDEQIKALTEAINALFKADAPAKDINAALRALEQGDTKEAEAIFAEVLRTKETEGQEANKEAAAAARHLGALAYMNNPQEAIVTYRKAVELDSDNAEGWNRLGALFLRSGELAQAEEAWLKVLALAEAHQNNEWQTKALGNLGNVAYTRGDLDKAEDMHTKALALHEDLGHKEGMAQALSNLGILYKTRRELDKAEDMHTKALALNEALGSMEGMARDYSNLGEVYRIHPKLAKAEEMYWKALELDQALGSTEGMAINYGNLGIVHGVRGDLDKAEEMHRKALQLNQALGRKQGMAANYANLGGVHEERGNLVQAEASWQKSLSLYEEMGAMQHHGAKIVQQALDELAEQRSTSTQ